MGYSPGGPKESATTEANEHAPFKYLLGSGLGLTSFEVILLPRGRQRDFRDWFFTGIQEEFES